MCVSVCVHMSITVCVDGGASVCVCVCELASGNLSITGQNLYLIVQS